MRRESSTVVGLAGRIGNGLLDELARAANVSLIRPPAGAGDPLEASIQALAEASRRMSAFVLVAADPLAGVASAWQAMWDVTQGPGGAGGFEQRAAEALAAWRAGRFELPDYYLVVATAENERAAAGGNAGFYLGPLRSARPRRVTAVVSAQAGEEAARVRHELRSLRHGPWWPPLDGVLDAARRFNAAGVAEAGTREASGAA